MASKELQQPIPEALKDEQLAAVTGGEGLEYTLDPSRLELKDFIQTGDIVDPPPLLGQIKPQSNTCLRRE